MFRADDAQCPGHPLADLGAGQAPILQTKGHLITHGQGTELGFGILLHQADHFGDIIDGALAHIHPRDGDTARRLAVELPE